MLVITPVTSYGGKGCRSMRRACCCNEETRWLPCLPVNPSAPMHPPRAVHPFNLLPSALNAQVVFEALDPATLEFSLTAPGARRIGAPLDLRHGEPLALRLLLDYSVLEVFTSSGQVGASDVQPCLPADCLHS